MMTLKDFKAKLDLLGADFSRWSDGEANVARELIVRSDEARTVYDRAQSLDRAMDAYTVPELDADSMTAMMHGARMRRTQQQKPVARHHKILPAFPLLIGGGGLAFAACVMIAVFTQLPASQSPSVVSQAEIAAMVHDLDEMVSTAQADLEEVDVLVEMLEVAQNDSASLTTQEEQEIEAFLNALDNPESLVPEAGQSPAPATQPEEPAGSKDVWDDFMSNG